MENGEAVAHVAADMIKRHGVFTPELCRENAKIDLERGDRLSAEAWRDIADEAERQLGRKP